MRGKGSAWHIGELTVIPVTTNGLESRGVHEKEDWERVKKKSTRGRGKLGPVSPSSSSGRTGKPALCLKVEI